MDRTKPVSCSFFFLGEKEWNFNRSEISIFWSQATQIVRVMRLLGTLKSVFEGTIHTVIEIIDKSGYKRLFSRKRSTVGRLEEYVASFLLHSDQI